jgi:hypothetical protein
VAVKGVFIGSVPSDERLAPQRCPEDLADQVVPRQAVAFVGLTDYGPGRTVRAEEAWCRSR